MKHLFRFLLLTVAMMLLGFSVRAGSITEEQAKAKALSFLQSRHPSSGGKYRVLAQKPSRLTSATTGETALYVFNVGERDGFVIVAADDRARPILGYTNRGNFDADHAPAALLEMLTIYARQIDMIGQMETQESSLKGHTAHTRLGISGSMNDVKPLLKTTWGQGAPYNDYCPQLNDETALTGCVATAMAQIAYYHKYPVSAVPNLEAYTSATNKINVTAWGSTTFDWDNMLESYSGEETTQQKAAVATLMRYCGQAARMDYGFTSGAYDGDALYAFTEKLGYDKNAKFIEDSDYSTDSWEGLIYKEVSEGRPVYYSALMIDEKSTSGHAFVIDGYQADGNYFHVNWGWNGWCDGYFNIFALDPDAPEAPVTSKGWHNGMHALVGLSPENMNTSITLEINVAEIGTLHTLVEEAAKEKGSTAYDVESITVTGNINNDDLRVLASMCTGEYTLSAINLSGASIDNNSIDDDTFRDKEKLASIILPETLKNIHGGAFYNCNGLTSLDIPASVTHIGNQAFKDCHNLATVTGMEGVSDIYPDLDWDIFYGTAITQPVYSSSVFLYMPPSITGDYEMPAGIKVTAAGSIRNSQLSKIILPGSLMDLGDDTFSGCWNLTDIYCYATTSPICHSGVWDNFYREACTIHVPASAVDEYKNADEWRDMGKIVGIIVGELVDLALQVPTAGTLNDALFEAAVAKAEISDKVLIRNLTVTGNLNSADIAYLNALPNTLYNMEMLDLSGTTLDGDIITEGMFQKTLYKAIKLPSNVKRIEVNAFRDNHRLREITLPESLEYIGSYAFAGCALTHIEIPDNVTEMGDRGVQDCRSLTSIVLGDGISIVPDCWAEFCDNLKEVRIGKHVKEIHWRSFYGANIEHVYSYARNPSSWNDSFYDGINGNAVLHVYSNSVNRYRNAAGWDNFTNIQGDLGTYQLYELAVNVATMGTFSEALHSAMAEAGCDDIADLVKLTVTGNISHSDLDYIRDQLGAYLNVLDLSEVTVEGNVFNDGALCGCAFEELLLPVSLTGFNGWRALEGLRNLKTIEIPNNIQNVWWGLLNGASSLETVTGGAGVNSVEEWCWPHFSDSPNLKSPVILGNVFFRLPYSTEGAYTMPAHVKFIAWAGMCNVSNLTELTLSEDLDVIYTDAFAHDYKLKDIYFPTVSLPNTVSDAAFRDFDKTGCTLHVYDEMVDVFKSSEKWNGFKIVGDLGTIPNVAPMIETDYADLCELYEKLNGTGWTHKWLVDKNVQTASRWNGVTFDEEGYVTSIDLKENGLKGDISAFAFKGMSRLSTIDISANAITGDIKSFAESLPAGCKLNVERQDFGYIGEHTLYELCGYTGLPAIAYYNSENGTTVSTLIGVGGYCKFFHEGTDDESYWDSYIHADGGAVSYNKFRWSSPVTLECHYPHHFTFTYKYEMGDVNMDDVLNVLDLQSTLNYSNGQQQGLFNFYAADTYGSDDDINVQDIVATVNILLALEDSSPASVKARGKAALREGDAFISVENGEIILYTTIPVAALDLRIAGISPENLCWNTEDMGFATAMVAQAEGTHAIIYSMQPRQIKVGRIVLATFDEGFSPDIMSAALCDSQARLINLGNAKPTGINQMNRNDIGYWSLTNLSGIRVAAGTHATETDVISKAKDQQLKGVFILNMDGVKRKIAIK